MKTITIKGLWLQFDADQITEGTDLAQAEQALYEINLILQRQPYALGAQILYSHIDNSDIESEEIDV